MDAVQIELLEEYKYVDSICRDMLSAEKGVTAYIEQMEATQPVVRYKIVGWDDDYRKLKHIRWLRNKIAHSTGNVECMPSDVIKSRTAQEMWNVCHRMWLGSKPFTTDF